MIDHRVTIFDDRNPIASVLYALGWYAHFHQGRLPERVGVPASGEQIARALPAVQAIELAAPPGFAVKSAEKGVRVQFTEVPDLLGVVCWPP